MHLSERAVMKRVTGIGGVFFRARDPEALAAWYAEHLGVPVQGDGYVVFPESSDTVWSPWTSASRSSSLGRFGWAIDPEGNRFELWEPRSG